MSVGIANNFHGKWLRFVLVHFAVSMYNKLLTRAVWPTLLVPRTAIGLPKTAFIAPHVTRGIDIGG